MKAPPFRILAIELRSHAPERLFFHECLQRNNYTYSVRRLGTERTLPVLIRAFFLPLRMKQYDVVITNHYFASFAINLRLLVARSKVKHVTISLNQSRKLLKTGFRGIDRVLNKIFRRTDLAIVHSRREAQLFSAIHRIPAEKFYFSLWGFDLPSITASHFSQWPNPYVCLVGRNNRDIDTFLTAVDGMDIDGIVITSSRHAPSRQLPKNAHVFCDLPQNDTFDCIKNAVASTVLLKDNERGAGHITAVAAMFSGVPQIVSDVDVIKDYLVDGFSAIAVPLGDSQAVRRAINLIMNDPGRAAELSANARSYARRWLTNERVSERIVTALNSVREEQEITGVDPDWLAAHEAISRRAHMVG